MGWGTSVEAEVYLSRKTFSNIYELDSHMDELRDDIADIKRRLSMLAIANPKDSIPVSNHSDDQYDPIFYIDKTVQDELTQLSEYSVELYKCELIKENWDKMEKDV